jgi:hypothetical protein
MTFVTRDDGVAWNGAVRSSFAGSARGTDQQRAQCEDHYAYAARNSQHIEAIISAVGHEGQRRVMTSILYL